jgi:hypothetical protein
MDVPKFRPKEELHLDEKCLKDNLGSGNTIFVGSSTDMWARESNPLWIVRSLQHCWKFDQNTYVFQTKNPAKIWQITPWFRIPPKHLLGVTIESDIHSESIYAPNPHERWEAFAGSGFTDTFISIEPIMDFTLCGMLGWMADIRPRFVSIGANSRRDIKLPEPPPEKIQELIAELSRFTEVRVKDNLKRLTLTPR